MSEHEPVLEREVEICARRDTVFHYFTDSERFAAWWGSGSTIDARPGGAVHIRYPNGVVASGEVVELAPPERIVFTYGYEDPRKPVPPGGSRVTITLDEIAAGTRLRLRHELPDVATRDMHVPGWRYQLAVFANVAAREQHGGAAATVDRFFAVWSEPDEAQRRAALKAIARPEVGFRDAFACTRGIDDLVAHIGAAQIHVPGTRLEREGELRQCQGTALADWRALGPDDAPRATGTNVFMLAPDGRIASAVGIGRG